MPCDRIERPGPLTHSPFPARKATRFVPDFSPLRDHLMPFTRSHIAAELSAPTLSACRLDPREQPTPSKVSPALEDLVNDDGQSRGGVHGRLAAGSPGLHQEHR